MDISKENQDYVLDSIRDSDDLKNTFSRVHAIYCERIDKCKLPIYDSTSLYPYKIKKSSALNTIIAMVIELEKLDNV